MIINLDLSKVSFILAKQMKRILIIFLLFFSLQASAGWVYNAELNVWYNTETGEIRITGDDDMDGDVGSVYLYSNDGQKINTSSIAINNSSHEIIISTIGLEQGIYYVLIVSADGRSRVVRFVVY